MRAMTLGPYQRFDTPEIAPQERFEYWRSWFSLAVDAPMLLDPIKRVPRDFRSSAEVLSIGDSDIVELHCGPAAAGWAREGIEPTHRLRLAVVGPTAKATGSWHGREVSLAHGTVTFLGNTDGRWHAPMGLRAIQVNVPRAAISVSDRDIDRINDPARVTRDPTFARLIRPLLLGVAGQLDTVAETDVQQLGVLWISLVNMLVRSLIGEDTRGVDTVAARRHQLDRFIHAHLTDPGLSPERIADALHVSRRTLYAAVAPDADGVAGEIRRQRLALARTMLLDPGETRPVRDIALAVGITNAAHFSRLFRDRYGASPSELRGLAPQPPSPHRGT